VLVLQIVAQNENREEKTLAVAKKVKETLF
jgi:hypothetical protein